MKSLPESDRIMAAMLVKRDSCNLAEALAIVVQVVRKPRPRRAGAAEPVTYAP